MTTVVASINSFTQPGKFYEVRIGKDGKPYCTCPAWRFGRGKPCKHMLAVLVETAC